MRTRTFVLLAVCVSFLLACGSCAVIGSFGPSVFTGWRTAISSVPVSAETQIQADPIDLTEVTPTTQAPQENSTKATQAEIVSLNYDESNSDPLPSGQDQLVAPLFRFGQPVTQAMLEKVVPIVQLMAKAVGAEVHEGENLHLDSYSAYFVWTPGGCLNRPTDVSDVLDGNYTPETSGRVWIQNVFNENVPERSDNIWNCDAWAVRVH